MLRKLPNSLLNSAENNHSNKNYSIRKPHLRSQSVDELHLNPHFPTVQKDLEESESYKI